MKKEDGNERYKSGFPTIHNPLPEGRKIEWGLGLGKLLLTLALKSVILGKLEEVIYMGIDGWSFNRDMKHDNELLY